MAQQALSLSLNSERIDRKGCLVLKINRNKQYVGIYNSNEADMCDEAGKYSVVCEKHHTLVGTETRNQANDASLDTLQFCDECREENQEMYFI